MSYNKIILEGNLTRDIEVRYTQSGSAIGSTGIAVNRKFKSQTGELKEEILFVDLTFFGRTAEIANQYLRKGSNVLIDGRLKLDQWTAQDGTKRSKHGVTVENMTMLGSKDAQPNQAQPMSQNEKPTGSVAGANGAQIPVHDEGAKVPEIDINGEDIPF